MEVLQNYLALLPTLLPPTISTPLIHLISTLFGLTRALQTHLTPLLTQVLAQPDIASVLLLVVLLWFSLQLLGMAYRSVLFWVRLAWQLVKWGVIVGVAVWVWKRGPDAAVEEAKALGAFWWEEFARFRGEAERWKEMERRHIVFEAAQRQRERGGWRWR